jgi:hypothetical protein
MVKCNTYHFKTLTKERLIMATIFRKFQKLHRELIKQNKTIEYNPLWRSEDRLFGRACDELILESGGVFACEDEQGRKIILVGTPVGNLIIYEFYSVVLNKTVLQSNQSNAVKKFIPGCEEEEWSDETFYYAFSMLEFLDQNVDFVLHTIQNNIGINIMYIVDTANRRAEMIERRKAHFNQTGEKWVI